MFDLPESFTTIFKDTSTGSLHRLPFLHGAPSKLLRAVLVELFFPSVFPGGESSPISASAIAPACQLSTPVINVNPLEGNDINLSKLLSAGTTGVECDRQKAAKNDDAPVPTVLWDRQLWIHPNFDHITWKKAVAFQDETGKNPLDVLRNEFFLPLWRKSVWRSWNYYYKGQLHNQHYTDENRVTDCDGARECLHYSALCTWWEWRGGSKLFFWRWPEACRIIARDGMPTWLKGELPRYRVPQHKEKDPAALKMVAAKLENVYGKGYVGKGKVESLTSYFHVKKGESDIRMVYDGTKCGLNGVLWVPSFSLPDVDNLLDMIEEHSWMADIDIGEMFLNFPLDKLLQPYCGVDFSPYLPDLVSWIRWLRCAMGLKPSPYVAIRFLLLGSEIIRGLPSDVRNALRYDTVRLNLPGMVSYNPCLPWVSKVLNSTGQIASDYVGYVDDLRPVGGSESACNACARQVSCMLNYLGIQDASRKRQAASKSAGVWAGSVVFASELGVGVNCTQEKWDKAKGYLRAVQEELQTKPQLNHKNLERIRGFLLYVTRTYPGLVPYLKGFHLTLDSWRPGRDSDGWRLTLAEMRAVQNNNGEEDLAEEFFSNKKAPEFISPSSRLPEDVSVLLQLTSAESPPKRFVRSKLIATACYGFGDASGSGFGSTVQGLDGVRYRHGLWGRDNNARSSNYRELCNLVEAIEEGVQDGSLVGAELFLFTDNTVAESAFYKGNTKGNKILFELIVRLRQIEMSGALKLWVIHISGTRMIYQGTDGISRGNFLEGVMTGIPMLEYVPLHLSAPDRSADIIPWLESWCSMPPCLLDPEDWFFKGHGITGGFINHEHVWIPTSCDKGLFVWSPPPSAGRAAIDQLAISRHKRPSLTHLFVCPRLFTHLWRKRLFKIADCVLEIPAGSRAFWPKMMFEPLLIGVLLPFSSLPPWQLRGSAPILELERQLRKVWTNAGCDERPLLRELFKQP